MTSSEIINILETAQSATSRMDNAHLKELKNILIQTQPSNRCVFFSFLSIKQTVRYLIKELLKSDDVSKELNFKQVKWIYKILGDYNYYPRCALCNQIIDISSQTANRRRKPDNPLSFSWDHIFPKSHGGSTSLSNLQPTHKICNNKKADDISYEKSPNLDIKINIQIGNKCVATKYRRLRPSVFVCAR